MKARALLHFLCALLLLAMPFAAKAGTVVTINADKVLVLNGRKVFPITMSPGPPTNRKTPLGDDALEELGRRRRADDSHGADDATGTARLIAAQQAALDWAAQHGMYCMVNLRELSAFAGRRRGDRSGAAQRGEPVQESSRARSVEKQGRGVVGRHAPPRISSADTMSSSRRTRIIPSSRRTRRAARSRIFSPTIVAADIFAIDIYPVSVPPGQHSLLPNKEISMVGD